MTAQEKISHKAQELGIDPVYIEIIFKTKDPVNKSNGWKIDKVFPGQEKEIKELESYVLNLRLEKEIKSIKPNYKFNPMQI